MGRPSANNRAWRRQHRLGNVRNQGIRSLQKVRGPQQTRDIIDHLGWVPLTMCCAISSMYRFWTTAPAKSSQRFSWQQPWCCVVHWWLRLCRYAGWCSRSSGSTKPGLLDCRYRRLFVAEDQNPDVMPTQPCRHTDYFVYLGNQVQSTGSNDTELNTPHNHSTIVWMNSPNERIWKSPVATTIRLYRAYFLPVLLLYSAETWSLMPKFH